VKTPSTLTVDGKVTGSAVVVQYVIETKPGAAPKKYTYTAPIAMGAKTLYQVFTDVTTPGSSGTVTVDSSVSGASTIAAPPCVLRVDGNHHFAAQNTTVMTA
jgi:hypothetical protein